MLQLTDSPTIQSLSSIEDAYEVCRRVTAKYSKTFYTGTMLMAFQIERARRFYAEAESGIGLLSEDARWPVWSALALYRQILDVIEENGYDVFTQRAYVPSLRKLLTLPGTLLKARVL